jgi:hypothetical protein
MSLWSALGNAYKDVVGAAGSAEQWFEQRISEAGHWVEGVFDGHPDAQAVSIAEIVRQIHGGYGSSDLHQGVQVVNDQTRAQMQISDGSHDLVQRLESAWSGQGADAAQANIRPLAVSADDASQTLSSNGQHIQTQADTFDGIRNSLQAMADPAPEQNWYDNFVPGTTDAEQAVDQYNQQARQNQQIYDQYHQSSMTVGQAIQIDYGHLPDSGDAQVSTFQLNTTQPGKTTAPQDHSGAGYTGGTGGGASGYQAPSGSGNFALPAASVHPATRACLEVLAS